MNYQKALYDPKKKPLDDSDITEDDEFGLEEMNEQDNEYNNGPTGHGDICMSDADPGL